MCANSVLLNFIIFLMTCLERDEQVDSFRCINIGMKYELVEWFGIELALHGHGFKPWLEQNNFLFVKT